MKAMVINFSGNVGKSTITKYLLAPRLEECKVFSIESVNANEHDEENVRGNALGLILDEMMLHDNAVLDVGSSNSETVINLMKSYSDAHEDFDLFILPVISKPKVIKDTLATADALGAIGVPPEKILIVMNQVDVETDIKIEFHDLIIMDGVAVTFDETIAIPMHDFFTRIADTGIDFLEVINDETDYSKLVRETEKDSPLLGGYVLRRALKRLANSLSKEFDVIFSKIEKAV